MSDYANFVARENGEDAPDTCFCARDLDDDGLCPVHGDPFLSARDRRAASQNPEYFRLRGEVIKFLEHHSKQFDREEAA